MLTLRRVLIALGSLSLVAGALGFVAPTALGMHLSPAHNAIHLLTGALSLWFGLRGSVAAARAFSIAFGAVYGLLGLAGIAFGVPGSGMHARYLAIVPGHLEFGLADHLVHVGLGAVYLIAGLATHLAPRAGDEHRGHRHTAA